MRNWMWLLSSFSLTMVGDTQILFFLWGFSYGLLDTLNKHFQNTLGISKSRSSGLQAAYFGYVCHDVRSLEFGSSLAKGCL
jgi:fucose permease